MQNPHPGQITVLLIIITLLTFTTAMNVRHLGQFMFMTNNVDQEGVGVILFEKLSLDFLENLTFFCCYP